MFKDEEENKYKIFLPCCGYFLQGAVRIISLIDLILGLFIITITGSLFPSDATNDLSRSQNILRIGLCVNNICISLILTGISFALFRFSKQRNLRMGRICLYGSTGMSVIFVVNSICAMMVSKRFQTNKNLLGYIILLIALFILYKSYTLRVVYSFMKELKGYGDFNCALRGLTDAEVMDFLKGTSTPVTIYEESMSPESRPYDRDFEISRDSLLLDEANPLGEGAFGKVYKAQWKMPDSEDLVYIAVKTTNPESTDVTFFKTLLTELKLMAFLERHVNIVNLIGACTSEIQDRKLIIVLELCPHGSLFDYVRTRRGLYRSEICDGKFISTPERLKRHYYEQIQQAMTVCTTDLIKWSVDAASGMRFLARNKIVHGDVASRNILLGEGKVAKISDFGLSTKLRKYSEYIRKEMELLPWRWMSPESILQHKFSIQSDVWAFGITLWEIFSLCETPYPGMDFDKAFIRFLLEGNRLTRPSECLIEIFELICQCWKLETSDRPSFDHLVDALNVIIEKGHHFSVTSV